MDKYIGIFSEITLYFSIFYPILYIRGFVANNKAFKIFTIYLIAIAIVQFSMRYHNLVLESSSNLHLFVYYFVSQFVLLSLFYKELLSYKWIYIVTIIVLVFIVYQYIANPEMYNRYNPIGSSITQIIIVVYAILYFYKSLAEKKQFQFVNIGIFFYLLSSVLIFASGNLVFISNYTESISNQLANINKVLFLFFQILIIIEWWKNYSVKENNKNLE
ncbi:hypothetical protein ATE92_2627 [Ulvibacter sp. MAR_2010_11]|nr:hypothetical protein ATE92_2627 [Ulvibacter sp. MAR_2010_11]